LKNQRDLYFFYSRIERAKSLRKIEEACFSCSFIPEKDGASYFITMLIPIKQSPSGSSKLLISFLCLRIDLLSTQHFYIQKKFEDEHEIFIKRRSYSRVEKCARRNSTRPRNRGIIG